MNCVTAAFENYNISCLETKTKRICRNIRTCLIDDSNNTKRNSFLPDQKTVRAFFHSCYLTDRILQGNELAKSLCHSLDSFLCEEKTIHQTFRHLILSSVCDIDCIGFKQLFGTLYKMLCHSLKDLILLVCCYVSKLCLSFFGVFSKLQ